MSEATVGAAEVEVGVEEAEEDRYRDRRSLEAELQAIARSKAPHEDPPRFWSKRRRKR